MAPIPSNNTAVYYVDYVANGQQHTVQFRYAQASAGQPPAAADVADVQAVLNGMRPFMPLDWAILGTRQRDAFGTVSIPSEPITLAGTGLQPAAQADVPGFISFVGRSPDGVRVRITLLGVGQTAADSATYDNDYRILEGESSDIAAVLGILDTSAFLTVSGLLPRWKRYANVGYNSYWQRKVRQ